MSPPSIHDDPPSRTPMNTRPMEEATVEDLLRITVRRFQSVRDLLVPPHG